MNLQTIEYLIRRSQTTDCFERSELAPLITKYNKEAKKLGTQKVTLSFLLQKNLTTFVKFLEGFSIDIERNFKYSFRTCIFYSHIIITPGVSAYISRHTHLPVLFNSYLKPGTTFKLDGRTYITSPRKTLHLDGDEDTPPLDISRYFLSLEEF